MDSPHRCIVKLVGRRGCEHELCVPLRRGVPPELRCADSASDGYGGGGGGVPCGCQTPPDIVELVSRELRDNLMNSRSQGFVLIKAA